MKLFRFPLSQSEPTAMTPDEIDAFARRTGWIDDIGVISAQSSSVQTQPLPWWPGRDLIIARDLAWNGTMAVWIRDTRLHRLTASAAIHAMNAAVKPTLTPDQALEYLGFFCTFVHGEDGPFLILSSGENPLLPSGLDTTKIAGFLRPPSVLKTDDKGHHIEAFVYYAGSLFLSNFIVAPSGMCEMIEDEPVVPEAGEKLLIPLQFKSPEQDKSAEQH